MNTADQHLDSTGPIEAIVGGPLARRTEPIPGYVIKERIGTGGYGEVWKAEAPGGLMKAVKFVYGALDDVRASRELKSLNRIKEVHHPFLLSLERIEVVDGQLVIVTELADSCLKDRFVECRNQGLAGIPRDELLGYLRDAAEALDYLYEKHTLQHLDVKPENLLLLSGRIKVADFGLLKDLRDTCASQMGGLTPTYSPPEVFDGRPSRHSDQYSLAIVYQEMLTGEPPFGGRTTAQLAAQHLHSPPVLGALPPSDQPIIARALAKDAKRRFGTCRELVEELLHPKGANRPRNLGRTAPPVGDRGDKTQVGIDPRLGPAVVAATQPMSLRTAEIRSLPPLKLPTDDLSYGPVVFVGLGGTGARVLCRIRRRLNDFFHDLDQVPTVQLLLLDTDIKSLAAATYSESGASLRERDTVALRLRKTKDYQSDSKQLLEWMSRRWLYNIPRSLQTEGMRPLGRLAFVDHAKQILQRLRKAISTAAARESLQQAVQATGVDFQALPPRVIVVSSIAGGTGSGAVIDLGYAVRSVLADLGQSDEKVCGILTHGTSRKASARDLAIANTCACLHELRHFSRPETHYPGDAAADLPAFEDAPFRNTYLVHLGDELDDGQFEAGVDSLAEYLFRSSLTSAVQFFDRARCDEVDAQHSHPATGGLRSFGLSAISGRDDLLATAETDALCRSVIQLWRGAEGEAETLPGVQSTAVALTEAEIHSLSAECADVLGLHLDPLSERSQSLIVRQVGDPQPYCADLVSTLGAGAEPHERVIRVLKGIDALLGARGQAATTLREFLNEHREQRIERKASTICKWIFELVNTSRARIRGAHQAAAWFDQHLTSLKNAANDLVEQAETEANRIRKALWNDETQRRPQSAPGEPADRQLVQYAYTRIIQAVHQETLDQLRLFLQHARNCATELRRLESELIGLATSFVRREAVAKSSDPISQQIHRRRLELAALVDQGLAASFFSSDRSLCHVLGAPASERQDLVAMLRTTARDVILRTGRELSLARLTASLHSGQGGGDASVREHLRQATPRILACGGAKRLLLIAPDQPLADRIQEQIWQETTDKPTVLVDPQAPVLACYEVEDVPVNDILRLLVGSRADYLELAARLHTRSDVDWSPFPAIF